MEFLETPGAAYTRKVVRGQSTCFECLEQRDVVLQVISKTKDDALSQTPVRFNINLFLKKKRAIVTVKSFICISIIAILCIFLSSV